MMNYSVLYKEKRYNYSNNELIHLFNNNNDVLYSLKKTNIPIASYVIIENTNESIILKNRQYIFTDDLEIIKNDKEIISVNIEDFNKKNINKDQVEAFKEFILDEKYKYLSHKFFNYDNFDIYYNDFLFEERRKKDKENIEQIIIFLYNVLDKTNHILKDDFDKHIRSIRLANVKRLKDVNFKKILLINIINAIFLYPDFYYEELKSNAELIYKTIGVDEIIFNSNGLMKELPKNIKEFIKTNNYQNLIVSLQKLNISDEDYDLLISFFNTSKHFVKYNKRKKLFELFLKTLSNILSIEDYNFKDLLSYLIKESYYRPCNVSYFHYNKKDSLFEEGHISFPIEEIVLLEEYLELSVKYNIEYKKYPEILFEYKNLQKKISKIS